MDDEYARFLSELGEPPVEACQPAGSGPPGPPPPRHGNAHAAGQSLPPPPGPPPRPNAAASSKPGAIAAAAIPTPRPAGAPPPLTAAAINPNAAPASSTPAALQVKTAPLQPPPGRPPPLPSAAAPSYGAAPPFGNGSVYCAGPQPAAAPQPAVLNPYGHGAAFPDPDALRKEILAEKKDGGKTKHPKKGVLRVAGGETWMDDKMEQWPDNDFRIFVGNLGPEVTEDTLAKAFQQYPSFTKCRIIKDYKKNKTKGFGFVSLMEASEGTQALKQMNGKYIGNRPCQLKKSTHESRNAPGGKKRTAMLMNPLERITTKRMR